MTNLNITIQSQIKATVESDKEFAVPFEDAWQWLEYSKKSNAKRALVANFEEGVDYSSLLTIEQREIGATRVEEIYLTKDCLKQLSMLSGTAKGKAVRLYFIECEKQLQAIRAKSVLKLPETYIQALECLLASEKEKEALALVAADAQAKIIHLTPKAQMFDVIADSGKCLTVGEVSKLLSISGMGRNNLFHFLRSENILQEDNLPYQRFINSKHFTVAEKSNKYNNEVYLVTLVTQKGVYFIKRRLEKAGWVSNKLTA
ncbi:phage antirepressor KilAC domain-containing protein [Nodularia sphaerocarpa]|uniref:phage antirepressor KilAC domain-containing protein n=1 Tax=Nodularia sphaerocarpa TaxID=137816 RepID=UPI001EFB3376|nr:phage antirepressor KilAC domain-containing protein [Nodularia sphaerocarpa]MDB9374060.1 phage antirepressor KilAC domain-containing protein [Nodularia sphaerocarpa CS-585]ULP71453.1 hypothetical protein BDGGKGIB_01079 [Nodularia sphaerocarpa UHCC 0038]